ncbi:MAG: DUF5518 domain-containing protein [Dehalococcoidia bacterium]
MLFIGVLIGFIAMIFLDFIPILGPILGGFVAGVIARGPGRGALAGFLSGILGAVILAILVTGGFGFFGSLFDLPIIGTFLGGAIGIVILVLGLYNGFLGLVGGAIGGFVRGTRGRSEPDIARQRIDSAQHMRGQKRPAGTEAVSSQTDTAATAEPRANRKYLLGLKVVGNGVVVPAGGSHECDEGAVVYVAAKPDEGWQFVGWIGEVKDPYSTDTSIVMDADKNVTASFQRL